VSPCTFVLLQFCSRTRTTVAPRQYSSVPSMVLYHWLCHQNTYSQFSTQHLNWFQNMTSVCLTPQRCGSTSRDVDVFMAASCLLQLPYSFSMFIHTLHVCVCLLRVGAGCACLYMFWPGCLVQVLACAALLGCQWCVDGHCCCQLWWHEHTR